MNKLLVLTVGCALAGGFAVTAFAKGAATTEISTAHAHALMAQKADTLDMAHTHLHHVVNCLVGPKGAGFDAAAGTPCKGEGNGAIPDSAGNGVLHGKLQSALTDAEAGLKTGSLKSAQTDAAKAAAALGATPAQKTSGGYTW